MATVEGDANSAFSAALITSFEDLIHKSLKDEQTECIRRIISCIRRIISFEEAVLPVLPTGFGKSVNCNHRRTTLCVRD